MTFGSSTPFVPVPLREVSTGADPKWWTLVAVCLGTFMLLLDVTIVTVALPSIQRSLHSSFSHLQWVVDAYALALAALLLTSGSLADLYGRRRLWVLGLALFTGASALCGAAQSTLMLELARALQGVGGAIMLSVSLALLASAFPSEERGVAFAAWGAITGVAVAVGPIVGGALVTGLSWRYIFYVNVPVGLLAGAISLTRVVESRAEHGQRPDWIGLVCFAAALTCLIYALIESGRAGFGAAPVVECFILAGVLFAAFVVAELRNDDAMFDLSLLRLPTFAGGAIAAVSLSAGIFAIFLFLVLYLQEVLGYSALGTGLRLLVISSAELAMSGLSGRLISHVPMRVLIGCGLGAVGAGLVLMRGLDAGSTWTHLVPGMILAGAGIGFANPPLASTAVGVVTPHRAGMASGISSTFRQVGLATGIALLGALFSSRLARLAFDETLRTPLRSRSGEIASGLRNGQVNQLFRLAPVRDQPLLTAIVRGTFTTALNEIFLVAAVISFIAAALAFGLIRSKDFASQGPTGDA